MRPTTVTQPVATRTTCRPPTAELATTCGSWRLVVSFHWCEDRFEHRLVAVLDPSDPSLAAADAWPLTEIMETRKIAANAEDETACNWPLNPPLQQLDECLLTGGGRGVVGLGMAGTSHWSMAVEARDQELWFDVACRVQAPPGSLQSCYRLADRMRWADGEPMGAGQAVLRVVAEGQTSPLAGLLFDPSTTALRVSDDRRCVFLRPGQIPERFPATLRWRYGWVAPA